MFENSGGALIEKNKNSNIETVINLNENITAPIFKNDILGTISYKIDNEVILEVNLVAEKDIPKKSFSNFFKELTNSYFRLLT